MFNKHPNPIFARDNFILLDGQWDFKITKPDCGFSSKINVPFCPESELSGLKYQGEIIECEYQRTFNIDELSSKVFLHFGAVDYQAKVYVNNQFAGIHRGGFVSFKFEITKFIKVGQNTLKVEVWDNTPLDFPSGKQTDKEKGYDCFYTRTTGIWQSVFLEKVPEEFIKSVKYYPSIKDASVKVDFELEGEGNLEIDVTFKGKSVGNAIVSNKEKYVAIKLSEAYLWDLGEGNLYDVTLKFHEDIVHSYFGLREVRYEGKKFFLNNKCVFQRLVLDQGINQKGLYSSPNEEFMLNDIKIAKNLGFNGARLHQKIFEPRFLYYCDLEGYMVWGEYPSWGSNYSNLDVYQDTQNEWEEEIDRDFNHPSIITWCPLNEVFANCFKNKEICLQFIDDLSLFTKKKDPTRPVVGASGGLHGHYSDVLDIHYYQTVEKTIKLVGRLSTEERNQLPKYHKDVASSMYPNDMPISFSEYGGLAIKGLKKEGWGYLDDSNDEEAFIDAYKQLTLTYLSSAEVCGFCYTQLYDVEQEQNGLYFFDRTDKLTKKALEQIKNINQTRAKIEE